MARRPIRFSYLLNLRQVGPVQVVGLIALLLGLTSQARADITMTFDGLKSGDKISDVEVVIVRADGGVGVDKVEFAVDDQPRFSTGSSPYTFKWDTITDTEGAHTLAVTAIDANGVKKTETLSLTIDNEIPLGAPALAARARAALGANDTDAAYRYSRRALKADPDNIEAARAMASYLAGRQNWDRAIRALENMKSLSQSVPAMLELASYRMQRGVLPENSANLISDFDSALALRRKAADASIDNLKAMNLPAGQSQTDETLGDALVRAARYREAIQQYSRSADSGQLSSTNRLALAYTLNEQPQEAMILLRPVMKDKHDDGASRAVLGLALLRSRRFAEARQAVDADMAAHNPASLIVAAYADAVLGNAQRAGREANEAAQLLPGVGEIHYALSMTLPKLDESEAETIRAIATSPFQTGPLIDYAVRYAMLNDRANRADTAVLLTDLALKTDPENQSAKLVKVLLLLYLKRIPVAEPVLADLVRRNPQGADIQAAASIYFDLKGNTAAAVERLKMATTLDKVFFDLGIIPKPLELLYRDVRKIHYRGGFYLSPETLYPSATSAVKSQ